MDVAYLLYELLVHGKACGCSVWIVYHNTNTHTAFHQCELLDGILVNFCEQMTSRIWHVYAFSRVRVQKCIIK